MDTANSFDTSIEHYHFTGLPNTRDLGGIVAADGKRVRPGMLLRSSTLNRATAHDRDLLIHVWHMDTIIDFRNPLEQDQEPYDYALFPGVTIHSLSALSSSSLGISHEEIAGTRKIWAAFKTLLHPEALMDRMYSAIPFDPQSVKAYRSFFELLLQEHTGGTLWHCTMGKDRAGLATALLLHALGATHEAIMADYLATNDYLAHFGQAENKKTLEVYHLPRFMMWAIKIVNAVRAEYLETAWSAIENAYGSVDAYLEQQLGVTAEKRAALQERYLE